MREHLETKWEMFSNEEHNISRITGLIHQQNSQNEATDEGHRASFVRINSLSNLELLISRYTDSNQFFKLIKT